MTGKLLPLTERLRNNQKFPTLNTGFAIRDCLEAADEIERLNAIIADRNEAIAVFQDVVERNNIELKRLRDRLATADAEIDRLQDIIRTYPDSHICPSCGGPCIGCECVRKRNKELMDANSRLRGLLRAMTEHLDGHPYYSGWAAEWHTRAEAALEGTQ